jgi:hypothetical protein
MKYAVLLRSLAEELRAVERSLTQRQIDAHRNRAKAYKALAENELRLTGAQRPQAPHSAGSAPPHAPARTGEQISS